MGSEWPIVSFKDAPLSIIDGDRGAAYPSKSEFRPTGYCVFLNTGNVTKEGFNFSSCEFISKERDELLRKGKLQRNDSVLTTRGTLGNVGLFSENIPYDHIRINSGMVIFRPNVELLHPSFLNLFLRSDIFAQQVSALGTGSAQPQLPIRDINRIEISLPPIEEQKRIAQILSSIDNKIHLNRQLNQTLEQMAQALFKSWFVDFDPVIDNALAAGNAIPDDLQDRAERRQLQLAKADHKPLPDNIRKLFPSEFELTESLGWVPKGWGLSRLDGILELAYGKSLSKTEREEGLVPVYGSGGITGYHNQSIVDGPGIIVGRKGTVGSLYWEPQAFFPIDTVFYVKPFDGISLEYCFLLLQTLGLEDMNTDAAVPGLNRNNAYRLEFSLPTKDVLEQFTLIAKSFREKLDENSFQISSLVSLRDTLLPKLISGELRIPEAQGLVEEVLG